MLNVRSLYHHHTTQQSGRIRPQSNSCEISKQWLHQGALQEWTAVGIHLLWVSAFKQSVLYLGGRPSRALFRYCGVLSVSAVERGTSGVSALESPSHSPSTSPCRPSLSSPSPSCRDKHRRTQILKYWLEIVSIHCVENTDRQQGSVHKVITEEYDAASSYKEKGWALQAPLRCKRQVNVEVVKYSIVESGVRSQTGLSRQRFI